MPVTGPKRKPPAPTLARTPPPPYNPPGSIVSTGRIDSSGGVKSES